MGRLSVLGNQGYKNGKKVPLWVGRKDDMRVGPDISFDTEGGQQTLDPIPVNTTLGFSTFCFQVEIH